MRLNEFIQYLTEYKRDITQQKLGDRLLNTAKTNHENVDIQEILTTLEQIDPTKHKQYVEWLCKQYISRQFRLEDATRVNKALTNFDSIKPRLEVQKRDINKYTLYTLEDAMDEIFNPTVKTDDFDVSGSDVKVLHSSPLGTLAIPLTKEASCRLGSGTRWCTAADKDNKFHLYNDLPLYIWKDKTGKYQFYFGEGMQFKDARDQDISPELLTKFRTEHPVLSGIFKDEEAKMMKNATLAYDYASDVLQREWPEAEPYIMKYANIAYWYAKDVLERAWPEAEPYIMKDANAAYWYAKNILEGEWPEAEPYIMKDAREAYRYAKDVLKDPNPETWAARYKKKHKL